MMNKQTQSQQLEILLHSMNSRQPEEMLARVPMLQKLKKDLVQLYFKPYMHLFFPEGNDDAGYQEITQFLDDFELPHFVALVAAKAIPVHLVAAYVGNLYPAFDVHPSEEDLANVAYQSLGLAQEWQGKSLLAGYPVVLVDSFSLRLGSASYPLHTAWGVRSTGQVDLLGLWHLSHMAMDHILGSLQQRGLQRINMLITDVDAFAPLNAREVLDRYYPSTLLSHDRQIEQLRAQLGTMLNGSEDGQSYLDNQAQEISDFYERYGDDSSWDDHAQDLDEDEHATEEAFDVGLDPEQQKEKERLEHLARLEAEAVASFLAGIPWPEINAFVVYHKDKIPPRLKHTQKPPPLVLRRFKMRRRLQRFDFQEVKRYPRAQID
jgi:hypothetical protein